MPSRSNREFSRPRPKQKLDRAMDEQDLADMRTQLGMDERPSRETVRIGNTKRSYKEADEVQEKRDYKNRGWLIKR